MTEPAPVSLPPTARSGAVVNRSLAADDSRAVDAIHGTISPESRDLQAAGAGASLAGLTDALIRSNGVLQWARKAYEVYKTPYALDYVNILQQRQSNDAVLRSQTELIGDR